MTLESGKHIGPYEVIGPLGAGGMGEVYRAHDRKLQRQVAIKVLPELVAGDPGRLARFRREAQLLASLNHPNIAAIYGLEEMDGAQCLVLELVEGETLAEAIRRGPLAPDDALGAAAQIAAGLAAAHDKGIVHRDLKPANVKVTPDGTVKVVAGVRALRVPQRAAAVPQARPVQTGMSLQHRHLVVAAGQCGPIAGKDDGMTPAPRVGGCRGLRARRGPASTRITECSSDWRLHVTTRILRRPGPLGRRGHRQAEEG